MNSRKGHSKRKEQPKRQADSGQPAALGFPIVALGASAGGLAALQAFFDHVPNDSGLAFVVVVHLSPAHESFLAELLQPRAHIPVHQVTATTAIEPNQIYIIPPGSFLTAIDTHLRLAPFVQTRPESGVIDHFFRTLAASHDGDAIGVILTGSGSDGSLGIKAIKERGGTAIVQDPAEAEYDGMPRNAIATGLVDLVLPLEEIPAQIIRITRVRPVIPVTEDGEKLAAEERLLLQKIFTQVTARTQRDFSRYKPSTIARRIQRRMQLKEVATLARYLDLLREEPDEVAKLADDFLINVTTFFRDAEVYALLESTIIPGLFSAKPSGESLRIWSVGCATGEEAYSMAILLAEAATRRERAPEFQIFASDLHEPSLKIAREGLYTGNLEVDVSPERLDRFFRKTSDGYHVLNELRERVVFAQHNVLADPPFSRLDMIVCRNLLIYLERGVQREVITLFHYALKSNGVLVLGRSETIDEGGGLFQGEDKAHGIFRKRDTPARESHLPVFSGARTRLLGTTGPVPAMPLPTGAYGALHHQIVEQYGPPSILVTREHTIVHVSEHAGRYLQFPGGEPSLNVFAVVREELRLELRTALHDAARGHAAVRTKPVTVQLDGAEHAVALDVRVVDAVQDARGFILIMFDEREAVPPAQTPEQPPDARDEVVRTLQQNLDIAQQRLRVVAEEYETNHEEMKTANEELQSSNEELRATLEELETSREELQSINEELATVNQENRHKVEELNLLTSDLQNLMVATNIPTLFLDRQLRILRFTPQLAEIFNVRVSDRGRPVSDLTHRLHYADLTRDAAAVLERLTPVEREVRDAEAARWYIVRIMPYRSADDHINGVVATFVDITAQKKGMQEIVEAKKHAEAIVDTIKEPLLTLTPELRVQSANVAFCEHFKLAPAQVEGQLFETVAEARWTDPDLLTKIQNVLPNDVPFEDHEVIYRSGATGERVILVNGRRLGDTNLILLGFRDVTQRKHVEEALREEHRRKDEFLATLAHELRNPLAAICNALAVQQSSQPANAAPSVTQEILNRQANQMKRLVDDLLDVSRINRGKVELRKERFDLNVILRNAITVCTPMVEAAGCKLQSELAPDEVFVDADPVRVTQIVSNLLNNAVKYTPTHGSINLALSRETQYAVIRVRDTGVGIAAESLPRIFDLFVQIDNRTVGARGGLGIGLTLVRNLVELHGGRIEAKSAGLGKGSEFVVWLPLAPMPDPAATGLPEQGIDAKVPGNRQQPSTVLVVDDDPDSGDSLGLLLRLLGHNVRVVYDGRTALQSMAADLPRVAIVDIGMPHMDGYEVARRVREARLPVTLVALTGWGQEKDRQASAEAGFDHHLVKPASLESLSALISSVQQSP